MNRFLVQHQDNPQTVMFRDHQSALDWAKRIAQSNPGKDIFVYKVDSHIYAPKPQAVVAEVK